MSCKNDAELANNTPATKAEKPVSQLENRQLTQEFKDYWYNGTAEISSYDISVARYGEMREGTGVMIFVTEPFDNKDQIKADQHKENNRPVLKLNATRDFYTGIYPYKIMSSTFLPLDKKDNAIKIATSIQEWCGHTYMQLNQNEASYDVTLHSYFQSEGNKDFEIDNVITENQIAAQLRIDPKDMPTGELKVIPSTEYLRLKHMEAKPYDAVAKLSEIPDGYLYSVKFTDLGRTIAFKTEKEFPYKILSWMDRYKDGAAPMVSSGTLKKTINTAYWGKNANKDAVLRDNLGL
ncbi:Maf-like protein [Nonlabens dokdonensis DSW-6]|uniref:Maf-like protein n=2 Tax=Nonlabens dokdonensis TaxID=328515 RepID=L7WED0_NONDD|nr:Maf-like protein [Nonlabens dokdonensis DSW-6]